MTVISTYGSAGANSYVSISVASSILSTTVIDYSAWSDATTVTQGAALIQSTRDVDGLNYRGGRYLAEQNLKFPLQTDNSWPWNLTYSSIGSLTGDIEQLRMYDRVQQATALQALYLLRLGGGTGRSTDLENQQSGISGWTESLGALSQSVSYRTPGTGAANPKTAEARLCGEALTLLAYYRESRRLYRA